MPITMLTPRCRCCDFQMTVSAYYNKKCFNNKLNEESKARFFGITLVFRPCSYYHSDSNSLKEIITQNIMFIDPIYPAVILKPLANLVLTKIQMKAK